MTITVRKLVPGDETILEAFLSTTPETTVFLRSSLSRAGLVDDGSPFSGSYAGAFDGERLTSVAASCWNSNVVVAPGPHVEEVAVHAVMLSGRRVGGILGPHDEVVRARAALGLAETPTKLWSKEVLYVLRLADLVVPSALREGRVCVRSPRSDELEGLLDWRMAYCSEASHIPDSPDTRAEQAFYLADYQEHGHHFVAEIAHEGERLERVAYSTFNATIGDVVQIGGVWTPAALRGRGYARCVVAGSLLAARERGVLRAVLFTGETNPAAQAAYAAIGFRAVGDYAIASF